MTAGRKFCNRRGTKETPGTKGMPATAGTLVTEEKEATVPARRGMLAKVVHQQDQGCFKDASSSRDARISREAGKCKYPPH